MKKEINWTAVSLVAVSIIWVIVANLPDYTLLWNV